jgi:hypothetical protein
MALLFACLPLAGGIAAPLVYLLGIALLVAWAAIAVHAWHVASRRRIAAGLTPGGTGAPILWLIPLVLALGGGLWVAAGPGADPALALDAYLADWRAGRAASGAARFAAPPPPASLQAAWDGQAGAVANAVVRIVAAEPAVEADPATLLDGLRWVDQGTAADGSRTLTLEAARSERVRNLLFGILPATSQRLVPVERLGSAVLRPVPVAPGIGPFGPVVAWRIVRIEIAGATIAGG